MNRMSDIARNTMAPPLGVVFRLIHRHAASPRTGEWDTGWRTLPHFLLETAADGQWTVHLPDGMEHGCPPGGGFVLPPGMPHRLEKSVPGLMHSSWMFFAIHRGSGLPVSCRAKPVFLNPEQMGKYQNLWFPAGNFLDEVEQQGLLLQLLRRCAVEEVAVAGDERIERALSWLAEHLPERPTRAQLARVAGLGEAQFHEVFRQKVGEPPAQYVRRLVISRAAELLINTSRSVSEIAEDCGFSSVFSFSRGFHRATGVRPLAYRRQREEAHAVDLPQG